MELSTATVLLVHKAVFIFAKTMPEMPHWYTKREHWDDARDFEECVRFIRANGYKEKFKKATYIYLVIGEYKYWTMGYTPERTTIINRAKI